MSIKPESTALPVIEQIRSTVDDKSMRVDSEIVVINLSEAYDEIFPTSIDDAKEVWTANGGSIDVFAGKCKSCGTGTSCKGGNCSGACKGCKK